MLEKFFGAISFLTIIPIGALGSRVAVNPVKAVGYFPLVGAMIGGCLALAYSMASLWYSAPVSTVAVLVVETVLTGGLHLDGLADTFDGLLSRKDREKSLEVMRDSRLGALGAVSLVLVLLAKYALLSSASVLSTWSLVLMPMIGKQSIVVAMSRHPYARGTGGLGSQFAQRLTRREYLEAAAVSVIMTAAVLVVGEYGLLATIRVVFGEISSLVAGLLFGDYLSRRFGGLTGDMYGAINEFTELIFLVAVVGNGVVGNGRP